VDYFLAVIAYDASGALSQPSMEVRARLAGDGGIASAGARTSATAEADAQAGASDIEGADAQAGPAATAPSLPPPSARALALEAMLIGQGVPRLSPRAAGIWRGLARVIDDPALVTSERGTLALERWAALDAGSAGGAEAGLLHGFTRLARAMARDGRPAAEPSALLRSLAIRAGLFLLPADADEEQLRWAVAVAADDLDPTGRLSELAGEVWPTSAQP
jgi:hypothetical protein